MNLRRDGYVLCESFFDDIDDIRRGAVRYEFDGLHRSAGGFNNILADDRVDIPVGAFDEHIGNHGGNDRDGRILFEQTHGIDARELRNDVCPVRLGHDGTKRPFDAFHGRIRIHADNEYIAQFFGCVQIFHVASVHNVEDAVGEDDGKAERLPLRALS